MSSAVIFGGCGFIGLYYAEELINQKSYNKIYLVDIKEPEDDFGQSKYKNILEIFCIFLYPIDQISPKMRVSYKNALFAAKLPYNSLKSIRNSRVFL